MQRHLDALNWRDFSELLKSNRGAILPVGTIEAHGCTNLGTDNTIPEYIAEHLAERLDLLIAPTISYGITRTLLPYPGSLAVTPEVFEAFVFDVASSLIESGFDWLLILNGHGGNNKELESVARELWRITGGMSIVIHWWEFCEPVTKRVLGETGGHAGIDETYMVMASDPELVKKEMFDPENAYLVRPGAYPYPNGGTLLLYEEGQGLPRFDPNEAQKYAGAVVDNISEYVSEVLKKWNKNFAPDSG